MNIPSLATFSTTGRQFTLDRGQLIKTAWHSSSRNVTMITVYIGVRFQGHPMLWSDGGIWLKPGGREGGRWPQCLFRVGGRFTHSCNMEGTLRIQNTATFLHTRPGDIGCRPPDNKVRITPRNGFVCKFRNRTKSSSLKNKGDFELIPKALLGTRKRNKIRFSSSKYVVSKIV